MKPGRKPTPTNLKLLRGNPGRRPMNAAEPEADSSEPSCPSWLDKEAKAEWKRVVASLRGMRLLSKTDRAALAGFCQQWSLFVKTSKLLSDLKELASMQEAKRVASINSDAYKNYTRICCEFGLTPSARTRLTAPQKPKADKFSDFMTRKSG